MPQILGTRYGQFINRKHFCVPVNAAWDESHVNGAVTQDPMKVCVNTTATANSRGMAYTEAEFLRGSDLTSLRVDWDKEFVMKFTVQRTTTVATAEGRVQLKEANTVGDLAAKGIGILIKDLAIWGEAYDVGREEVDLSTAMTSTYPYAIRVEHVPTVGVRFYVNNVLCGTSTKEPSTDAGATSYLVISIINGVTETDAIMCVSPIEIWQGT